MIDTLKYCKEFKQAGFSDLQAELLASKLSETTEHNIKMLYEKDLATKSDIHKLDVKVEKIRSNLLQWIISMLFAQTAVVIGAMFAMLKLIN